MSLPSSLPSSPLLPVHREGDLAFAQARNDRGEQETLHLDVYLPQDGSDALRPAVFWVHGGGFTFGNDKRQVYIPRFANYFAERGYVGIAPDYRVRADPWQDFPATLAEAVADIRAALAWVRAHSAAYRIDPRRIALAGGSAGGMTVLSLVHDPEQPVDGKKEGIFAVIDLWGTPGGKRRLFPQVNRLSPPTLVVHGTADELVPYQNSVVFNAEMQAAGVDCCLLTLPDAPHTPLKHFERIAAEVEALFTKVLA